MEGVRRAPARSRRVAIIGGVTLAVTLAMLHSLGAAGVTLVSGPPLPPQPTLAAAPCTPPASPPGGWTTLSDRPAPANQFAIDPSMPCHVLDATAAGALQRSDDSGAHWSTVFDDSLRASAAGVDPACPGPLAGVPGCAASSPPFTGTALSYLGPSAIGLAERGNGDAYVASTDGGATWSLRNSGIDGYPVAAIAAAPSDPNVVYAAVIVEGEDAYRDNVITGAGGVNVNPPVAAIFRTADGGGTWRQTQLPTVVDAYGSENVIVGMAVDPLDSQRLFILRNDDGVVTLEETRDGGGSVSIMPVSAEGSPSQFFVADGGAGPLLYALGFFDQAAGDAAAGLLNAEIIESTDGGSSWFPTKAQPPTTGVSSTSLAMAMDPTDPSHILIAGLDINRAPEAIDVFYSGDGLQTLRRVADPNDDGRRNLVINVGQNTPYGTCGAGGLCGPAKAALQADDRGNFYLAFCYDKPQPNPTPCGAQGQLLERFTAPASQPVAATLPSPLVGSVQPALELMSCAVPDPTNASTGEGGLAFDGSSLIYTQNNPYNPVAPADPLGHLYYMSAATCAYEGDVNVTFSAADLATVARVSGWQPQATPFIEDISYDARRNVMWGTIQPSPCCEGSDRLPIFTYTVMRPPTTAVPGVATASLHYFVGECPPGQYELAMMSYSYSDDTLWTCDAGDHAAHLRASDGAELPPSCFDPIIDPGEGGTTGYGDWAVVGDQYMLVHSENDTTMNEYTQSTCALQKTYAHRTFAEPGNEDEQMVCDPVTFGAHSTFALPQPAAVWIRDASAGLVTAYGIGESCPLPTALAVKPVAPVPVGAAPPVVCAELHMVGPSASYPLVTRPALAVDLTVAGQTFRGIAATSGVACHAAPAGLAPGPHPITATFEGTSDYLRSSAAGVLTVVAGALPASQPPPQHPQPGAVLTRGGGFGAVEDSGPPVGSTEVEQAATQAQANAQGQSALQPGIMAQPQQRTQVATRTVITATDQRRLAPQTAGLMAQRRQSPAGAFLLVTEALVAAAFGWAMTRVRPRFAARTATRPAQRRRGQRPLNRG